MLAAESLVAEVVESVAQSADEREKKFIDQVLRHVSRMAADCDRPLEPKVRVFKNSRVCLSSVAIKRCFFCV